MEPTIIEISWGKTVNLGNFESARLELKATVNRGQDWREIMKALKFLVQQEEQRLRALRRPPEED